MGVGLSLSLGYFITVCLLFHVGTLPKEIKKVTTWIFIALICGISTLILVM